MPIPRVAPFLIIMLVVGGSFVMGAITLSSYSYATAFEGAKAQFYGLYDGHSRLYYTNQERHSASLSQFGTLMKFDVDSWDTGMCNLVGEMTSVQVPSTDSSFVPPDYVPTSWWRDSLHWNNPINTYEWEVENSDGTTSVFHMEEWVTKWFFSVSAEWDTGPQWLTVGEESENKRYKNLDLCFEFDISPSWYFEGTDLTYFAIAKIELSDIYFEGKNLRGDKFSVSETVRTAPMSEGSVLTIYTEPFGRTESESESDFENFFYREIKLNPQYFREKVYSQVSLLDFGTTQWGAPSPQAKGDVVTMGFTVTQFVVGEWKVQDVGEIPEDYGRTPKMGVGGLYGVIAWWLNLSPLSKFLLLGGIVIGIIVLILIFTGTVPVVVSYALSRRSK